MITPEITAERAWTEAQLAAIRHVEGDLLVSAAAGSGKTAVLAERCARLVCDGAGGGCGVENLLVLTFTEAAANEMRGRIGEAIRAKLKGADKLRPERLKWLQRQGAMVERASISTLHAFCARVLRQHFHEAQIDPAFELMDEDEARLLREEVLEEVLGRWHSGEIPAGADVGAEPFAEFFEAYAQGRDSNCREMILRVHGMLASAADPKGYLRAARRAYSPEGSAETVGRYVRDVIGGQLRLLRMTAQRAAADAQRAAGPDAPISVGLEKVAGLLEWAERELQERGVERIAVVREALANPWPPRLSTMKDVPDFDGVKKRTWEKVKGELKKFCEETLDGDVGGMGRELLTLARPLEVLLSLVADFSRSFETAKRSQNRLDFSDLERLTLNLLTAEGSLAAAELRSRYHHVLVDEAQDINPLQDALLRAVRSADRFDGKGNLFVVGDVKQSIYGFRLADPGLFLGWERQARDNGGKGHVVLAHNFRSQVNLLGIMNDLFERVMTLEVAGVNYREGHALEAPPQRGALPSAAELRALNGIPVEVHLVAMNEEEDSDEEGAGTENLSAIEEEARVVAQRIAALMREGRGVAGKDGTVRPLAYRDFAILLRSMKNRAMTFAQALAREGIPVHADLATGYFDAPEVRETLALLQVLDNPQQDIPMATVMLGPYGGFLHDDLARLRLAFDRRTVKFADAIARFAEGRGNQAAGNAAENQSLREKLRAFLQKLGGWREMLRTTPLHEGLAAIYGDSKILAYVAGLEAGEQRAANLQALHQRALKFSGFSKQGLHRFLRFIEKLREQDGDFGEAPVLSEASDVVRIMSVHKSKGLEFPVVIVASLGGMLNLIEQGPVYVHRELGIGMHVTDVERNIFYPSAASACIMEANKRTQRAEELRLLYVAITRARDHLILSGHVDKSEWVERIRNIWEGHDAPLPEDVLLKGRRALEWVLPAIACSKLRVGWSEPCDETPASDVHVAVKLHAPSGSIEARKSEEQLHDEMIDRLLRAEPLPPANTVDAHAVAGVIACVTGAYAHEDAARRAAVRTVSALKEEESGFPDEFSVPDLSFHRTAPAGTDHSRRAKEARARGVATHRILELLDFSRCGSATEIEAQMNGMVERKELLAEDRDRADREGLRWFILETEVGKRIVAAAKRRAAGEANVHFRREIPFTWAAPVSKQERSGPIVDWATVRGTIDLLLVDGSQHVAEVVDYKTDSPFTWAANVEEYRRQVGWYMRAAREILGMQIERGTIVFLAVRQCVEVRDEETLAFAEH